MKRNLPWAIWLAGVFGSLLAGVLPSAAVDSILLKSGHRIEGKILSQSKDQVVMQIGEGQAVFSKRAIRRIYDDITIEKPVSRMLKPGELPPWWVPVSDLYHEDWVTKLAAIEATVIDRGIFRYLPYVSFRANRIYELNVYGDPMDPAAIEIGYYGRGIHSGEAAKRCRQFLASYLADLGQLKALYALSDEGGSETIAGLTVEITPPTAPDAYGGWWALVYNSSKVAAQRRPTEAAFRAACDASFERIKRSTDGETGWEKWAIKDVLNRVLPRENRIKEP